MIQCETCHVRYVSGLGKIAEIACNVDHVHQIFICDSCDTLIRQGNEVVITDGKIVSEAIRHPSESQG